MYRYGNTLINCCCCCSYSVGSLFPKEQQSLFQRYTIGIFTAPLKQIFKLFLRIQNPNLKPVVTGAKAGKTAM